MVDGRCNAACAQPALKAPADSTAQAYYTQHTSPLAGVPMCPGAQLVNYSGCLSTQKPMPQHWGPTGYLYINFLFTSARLYSW
jgi:hypothetical protein